MKVIEFIYRWKAEDVNYHAFCWDFKNFETVIAGCVCSVVSEAEHVKCEDSSTLVTEVTSEWFVLEIVMEY